MNDIKYPAWAASGKRTGELIQWLFQPDDHMLEMKGHGFVKARKDGCCLIYAMGDGTGTPVEMPGTLALCGIFNPKNYFLYDVGKELKAAAGIPEEFCFPEKQDIQREAESRISQYGAEKIRRQWDGLLAASPYSVKQLIPAIHREQIRQMAERLYHEGKTEKDVVYRPQFAFGKQFTGEVYLLYLGHEESVIRSVGDRWLARELPKIARERTTLGCVRNELQEILKLQKK